VNKKEARSSLRNLNDRAACTSIIPVLFRDRERKRPSRYIAGIAERINGNTEFPAPVAEKYAIAVTCDPVRARSSRK